MRKREGARPGSMLGELFAERQAYLRNGTSSRYVVLSRSLQIGVVVGLCLVVGWLAFASYSSVVKHLQTVEQKRELARLEAVNESLRAAAEAARQDAEQRGQAEQRLPEVTAALADAEGARTRAEQLAAAAAGEAEELRRELALAEDRIRELTSDLAAGSPAEPSAGGEVSDALRAANERIEQLSAERDALAAQIAAAEQRGSEATDLDQQLAEAKSQVAELNQRVDDYAAEAARLTNELTTTKVNTKTEIDELRQRLEDSGSEVARLNDDLAPARDRVAATEAGEAPTLAEIKAAGADDDLRRLREDLAGAEATIASLNIELEAAKNELEATRADAATAGPESAAPAEAAGGDELERLQAELIRANDRIRELESQIGLAVVNLAPPPSPPAPR